MPFLFIMSLTPVSKPYDAKPYEAR